MHGRVAVLITVLLSFQSTLALDIPGFNFWKKSGGQPSPQPALKNNVPFTHHCKITRLSKPLPPFKGIHPLAESPYWKSKSEVYRRIAEEKYIVVNARDFEENKLKVLTLLTAGHIQAPMDYTYDQIMNLDDLPKYVSYIKEAKFDPVTSNVFVHGALLGYHIKMVLKITPFQVSPLERIIYWESIQGGLIGMKGDILLTTLEGGRTEISMRGRYAGAHMPIPDMILKWGLEFAGQRAAASMRHSIEESFNACQD